MAIHEDDSLTVAEASDYLKVSRATIYRARNGQLTLYKGAGRSARLHRGQVIALIVGKDIKDREPPYPEPEDEQQGWLRLAETSFSKDWINNKDAIYDNWKILYALRGR